MGGIRCWLGRLDRLEFLMAFSGLDLGGRHPGHSLEQLAQSSLLPSDGRAPRMLPKVVDAHRSFACPQLRPLSPRSPSLATRSCRPVHTDVEILELIPESEGPSVCTNSTPGPFSGERVTLQTLATSTSELRQEQ